MYIIEPFINLMGEFCMSFTRNEEVPQDTNTSSSNLSSSSSSSLSSSSSSISTGSTSSSSTVFSPKNNKISFNSSSKNGSINSSATGPVVSSITIDTDPDKAKNTQYHLNTPIDPQLVVTKTDIQQSFAKYLVPYKINFLRLIGPMHKDRAKAVLAAIDLAKDIGTISLIINNQIAQLEGDKSALNSYHGDKVSDYLGEKIVTDLHDLVQLDERWTNSDLMVNKPVVKLDKNDSQKKDLVHLQKQSGYYRMLMDAASKLNNLSSRKTYQAFA
jgi:hypothetical protein